jgi:hypothetical protein
MDDARADRKPGQIRVSLDAWAHATAALEDRLQALGERLSDIRMSHPRPADPQIRQSDTEVNDQDAPLVQEIRSQTARVKRLEAMVGLYLDEIEL